MSKGLLIQTISEVVKAGTSEGAKKGWEKRKRGGVTVAPRKTKGGGKVHHRSPDAVVWERHGRLFADIGGDRLDYGSTLGRSAEAKKRQAENLAEAKQYAEGHAGYMKKLETNQNSIFGALGEGYDAHDVDDVFKRSGLSKEDWDDALDDLTARGVLNYEKDSNRKKIYRPYSSGY